MNVKQSSRKLSLNRSTVSTLTGVDMNHARGGTVLIPTIHINTMILIDTVWKPSPDPWKTQPDPWRTVIVIPG